MVKNSLLCLAHHSKEFFIMLGPPQYRILYYGWPTIVKNSLLCLAHLSFLVSPLSPSLFFSQKDEGEMPAGQRAERARQSDSHSTAAFFAQSLPLSASLFRALFFFPCGINGKNREREREREKGRQIYHTPRMCG